MQKKIREKAEKKIREASPSSRGKNSGVQRPREERKEEWEKNSQPLQQRASDDKEEKQWRSHTLELEEEEEQKKVNSSRSSDEKVTPSSENGETKEYCSAISFSSKNSSFFKF